MRILFTTRAGFGNFRPLLPFADASVAAGHEVAVAAPHSLAAEVTDAGHRFLPFAGIAPAKLATLRSTVDRSDDAFAAHLFTRLGAAAALPGVRAAIDGFRPSLIVRDPLDLASLVGADAAGIPQIPIFSGLQGFTRRILEASAEPLGLRPGSICTPSMSLLPPGFDPAAEPPAVHRFRNGTAPARVGVATPLVYLSYGMVSTADVGGIATLRSDSDALSELPVNLVVSTGRLEHDPWRERGHNVHIRPWVDEDQVLARADAVVCHGGTGTTLAALRAGVPLVVVPRSGDQRAIGDAVVAAGAGIRLSGIGEPRSDHLREAVGRILADRSYGRRAAALAREIGMLPPVLTAVRLFEQLAR